MLSSNNIYYVRYIFPVNNNNIHFYFTFVSDKLLHFGRGKAIRLMHTCELVLSSPSQLFLTQIYTKTKHSLLSTIIQFISTTIYYNFLPTLTPHRTTFNFVYELQMYMPNLSQIFCYNSDSPHLKNSINFRGHFNKTIYCRSDSGIKHKQCIISLQEMLY